MAWRLILLHTLSYCLPQCSSLRRHHRMLVRTAVNMSFKIIGEGTTEHEAPPILIFHGILGSKKHWEGLGKTILNMTKRTVIVADLRNHGDSPHSSSHTYTHLAEDILQLYEKLEIGRASLIGHSMGGRSVMAVSLIAPQKVSGVLVVDISPISTCYQLTEQIPNILNSMAKITFKGIKDIKRARKIVREQLRQTIPDDVTISAVLSNVNVKTDGTIGWTINLDALIKNIAHIITFPTELNNNKYGGPALFIGGQLSDFIPPDDLPGIRRLFPQAVITYIKGARHNVHFDDPKTFLEYTIKFIRTNK